MGAGENKPVTNANGEKNAVGGRSGEERRRSPLTQKNHSGSNNLRRQHPMRIDIVTLFPGIVEPALSESMIGRARTRGCVDIRVVNLRDYAAGRHRVTDDYQFGGGGGMVLKPEPLFAAVEALRTPDARVVLMDPRGRRFTQDVASELARLGHLILLAGRYEGVDERVTEALADETLSIGDYVLTGGELPALVVADAVTRLLPGALGGDGATDRESFASGLLEPPQYTRPEEFDGRRVPPVLLSGDHARIARWRRVQALWRTWRARPDLLERADLSAADRRILERFERGETADDVEPAAPRERDGHGRDSTG
jgi:tRNA (guanine37-N1)-methyltransferase